MNGFICWIARCVAAVCKLRVKLDSEALVGQKCGSVL